MKKVMKKTFTALMILLAAGLLFLIIAVPVSNEMTAQNVAKELSAVPLPNQTEYVESTSLAGKLTGNGNGMQYFGAILIRSSLPLEDLKAYYADYTVEHQTDSNIKAIEHGHLNFKSQISGNAYFIVYSWGADNSMFSELDLRGH